MEKNKMKIYLTKYALSKGIQIVEATKLDSGYWRVEGHYSVYEDKECHIEPSKAIRRAEEMQIAKLKSLDKQVKKISALTFNI